MSIITKRILCLANSRKTSGRCVAGIEWGIPSQTSWIRPVSGHGKGELSELERCYRDQTEPKLLDILDIPLFRHAPHLHQSENWLIAHVVPWIKVGELSVAELNDVQTYTEPLWQKESTSTSEGLNDKIPAELLASINHSIVLVNVDKITFRVFIPGQRYGNEKRRVQGHFSHAGMDYRLWVTDPLVEEMYLKKPDGHYERQASFLTISLGEPFSQDNSSQKLIAGVIEVT